MICCCKENVPPFHSLKMAQCIASFYEICDGEVTGESTLASFQRDRWNRGKIIHCRVPILPHTVLNGIGAGNYLNIVSFIKFSSADFNTKLTHKLGQCPEQPQWRDVQCWAMWPDERWLVLTPNLWKPQVSVSDMPQRRKYQRHHSPSRNRKHSCLQAQALE